MIFVRLWFLRAVLACLSVALAGHAPRVWAQSNGPVRLAVVVESPSAAQLGDLLMAELSQRPNLQLLERSEIERVYREQGLSAGNRNDLELGKLLGADGLVFLNIFSSQTDGQTNSQLSVRLTAVKPGVILAQTHYDWPVKEQVQMAKTFASGVAPFLPKISVSAKDAIAISVVNFRSAVRSTGAQGVEHNLKSLVIQCLSREPSFFVTERDRMRALSEEKELSGDESPFWNGGYLLEGMIDPNGYSPELTKVHVRLIARKGAEPIEFDAEGSRTNWAEVANQIGAKTAQALKIKSSAKTLDPGQEATQFFEEAKWTLTWKDFNQAQAAADAAWALGKRDVDCAALRIKAYSTTYYGKQRSFGRYSQGTFPRNLLSNHLAGVRSIKATIAKNPDALFSIRDQWIVLHHFNAPTSVQHLDNALYALNLYREFSQSVPGELKPGTEWYKTGVEDLIAASWVLREYAGNASFQPPVKEKLAELRAMARSVAMIIFNSPAVHDAYFLAELESGEEEELSPPQRFAMLFSNSPPVQGSNSVANGDNVRRDLSETVEKEPSIFQCMVKWGCFWQETPEATLDLYRELMSSPAFCYVHEGLWVLDNDFPRVIAWNKEDHKRIPALWQSFVQELNSSTNALLRFEGMALGLADIDVGVDFLNADEMLAQMELKDFGLPPLVTEEKLEAYYTNFFETMLIKRDVFLSSKVNLCSAEWHTRLLTTTLGRDTWRIRKLASGHFGKYSRLFGAMEEEYKNKAAARKQFARQVRYLKEFRKINRRELMDLFPMRNYTEAETQELLPLIAAYKTNLLGSAKDQLERVNAQSVIMGLQSIERRMISGQRRQNQTTNFPATQAGPQSRPQPLQTAIPQPVGETQPPPPPIPKGEEILTVRKFYEMPTVSLEGERVRINKMAAIHYYEGKILLDFEYCDDRAMIAVFDPENAQWKVVWGPEIPLIRNVLNVRNLPHNKSALFEGNIYNCDGGKIRRYDFNNKRWDTLSISDGEHYQLLVAAGHLYAANQTTIFEILDQGKSTRLLASTRRNPPASELDKLGNLEDPFLFSGPNRTLHACIGRKVYSWNGTGWYAVATNVFSGTPEIRSESGLLFREKQYVRSTIIQRLLPGNRLPELCLNGDARPGAPNPMWSYPSGLLLNKWASALHGRELYLTTSHAPVRRIPDRYGAVVGAEVFLTNGYHNELLCFSPALAEPQRLFLKFDSSRGCPPVDDIWIVVSGKSLFFGMAASKSANGESRVGYPLGIWAMPISELESAIAPQKQKAMAVLQQRQKSLQERRKAVAATHDRNKNGVLEPEEKEEALKDPAFIEVELDAIDMNRDGRLDVEELAYFDANQDKILQTNEEAGINLALQMLAQRSFQKLDTDLDGLLDERTLSARHPRRPFIWWRREPLTRSRMDDRKLEGFQSLERAEFEERVVLLISTTTTNADGSIRRTAPRITNGPLKEPLEYYWKSQNPGANQNR